MGSFLYSQPKKFCRTVLGDVKGNICMCPVKP